MGGPLNTSGQNYHQPLAIAWHIYRACQLHNMTLQQSLSSAFRYTWFQKARACFRVLKTWTAVIQSHTLNDSDQLQTDQQSVLSHVSTSCAVQLTHKYA